MVKLNHRYWPYSTNTNPFSGHIAEIFNLLILAYKKQYNPNTKAINPSEVCLHFNELRRYCVENELGREITKEETLEILKKSAEAGLVHGIADYVVNPDTIHGPPVSAAGSAW